jgi:PKD domain
MRVPRILLLISLLAVGLYSQAPPSAPAQQPNTVTIRPRVANSQPGIPEVKAVADRTRVPVGEKVTFTLSPASVIKDRCYQVTLFFGDKDDRQIMRRQVMRQPQTVHTYDTSGDYTFSILVQPVAGCGATPTPVPIPDVRLILTPSSVDANQPLTFVAELSPPARNFSYRFVFDDGSQTEWQTEPKAIHAYRIPKTYRPYVDIGLPTNGVARQLGGSKRQTITIAANQIGNQNGNTNGNQNKNQNNNRPNDNQDGNGNGNTRVNGNNNVSGNLNANTNTRGNANGNRNANANATPQASATASASPPGNTNDSQNDWWKYLIFVPLLMLAGYKAMIFFLLPRPTFVPHPTAGVAKASGLAFDYQVDVDPNVDGAFKIDAAGGNLIKAKRTSDD